MAARTVSMTRGAGGRRGGAGGQAGLLQRHQVAGEVAAVHGRDVGRLQHAQIGEVVPVEEVPAVAAHPLECPEDLLEALDHVTGADEAEIARRHDREELEPDVGG